jgi:hypothetical protein
MKKLLMLTAAAGLIFALAEPTLAAQRTHRALDAYASGAVDRSGAYDYGPVNGRAAYDYAPTISGPVFNSQAETPAEHIYSTTPYGGPNLPYADRPYGAPDRW